MKSLHGVSPANLDGITRDDLLSMWSNLLKEVEWKEKNSVFYQIMLQYTKENSNIINKDEITKDFFSRCLTTLNTDISMFHPEATDHI